MLLLIEVADSSLLRDRNVKVPLYARASVPEVWIVNTPLGAVEMFRSPTGGSYADHRVAERGQTISPQEFPDLVVAVNEILG